MELLDKLRGGIDAAMLKKIAIVTMFIDHLTLTCLEIATNEEHTRIMYTFPAGKRDRWKYLLRLLIFAAIAHVPFNLMAFPYSERRHTDTIFTLAAGYVVIWGITELSRLLPEKYRPVPFAVRGRGKAAETGSGAGPAEDALLLKLPAPLDNLAVRAVLFLVPSAALTYGICRLAKWGGFDYSYGGVLCILILYLFYRARDFSLVAAWLWLTYYNSSELLALTGFSLIRCYNGKRGKQNKYFFYIFYPGHLLLLYLMRKAVWGN